MIDKKMLEALNEQMNAEMYSSYLYLAMAAWFKDLNWGGFAKWLEVQSREEMGHAMKLYSFIDERNGRIQLKAIAAPPAEWKGPLDAFKAVLAHEEKVTGLIHGLVKLAADVDDPATSIFLQWFVTEQVEEEANATDIVDKLEKIGDAKQGLFMLDHALGERGG